jgi:hypothetical protein
MDQGDDIMTLLSDNAVKDHVSTIMVALDPKSPFANMVDLSELGRMPHEHQVQIWDDLEPAYQLLYEEMVKDKQAK